MTRILKQATETSVESSAPSARDAFSFRVLRPALTSVLKLANAVADRRSTLKALGNVAIRVQDGEVSVTATDLNVSMVADLVSADVRGSGGVMLPVKPFLDLVSGFEGDEIEIDVEPGKLRVSCPGRLAVLNATPDRDFPRVPTAPDDDAFGNTSAEAFAELLGTVDHAVCEDQTRFHLNGVYLTSELEGFVIAVATDGHRLALAERAFSTIRLPRPGVIVPSKGVAAISKLLGKGSCNIAATESHLFVRHGHATRVTLAVKTIAAQFPPYRQVIPTHDDRCVTVERKALIAALKRAKVTCTRTRGAKLTAGDGKLVIASDAPDTGETSEVLRATGLYVEGPESFSIGVNASYLLDALAQIDDKHVTIAFGSELDPMLVRSTEHACSNPPGNAPTLFVIMPMRI
jgi:DNA polymerase-3 subunit beta